MSERWLVEVEVDPAPPGDGVEFEMWCVKHDFSPLASGRRAWCSKFATYLRGAYGVASVDGEEFLVYADDLIPTDDDGDAA